MKKVVWIVVLFVGVISCKKEYVQPRSGIFRGVFEMTGLNGGGFETNDCTISINDNNNSYSFNADTTGSVPYPSGGSYLILDGTNMKFSVETAYDASSAVNQDLYLNDTYTYYFDDTRLELSKKVDTILYEYKFIRY